MNTSTQRGFTLFEMLVTMLILGVLSAIAVPALSGLLARQRVSAARFEMHTMLMLARSEALNRGQRVALCPTADGQRCRSDSRWEDGYLLYVDRDFSRDRSFDEPILRQGDWSSRVRITTTAGRKVIIFHPDGSAAGYNVTVSLCAAGQNAPAAQLVLSNAGRLRSGTGPACQS